MAVLLWYYVSSLCSWGHVVLFCLSHHTSESPHICKNNKCKINCELAIGQHLITNPHMNEETCGSTAIYEKVLCAGKDLDEQTFLRIVWSVLTYDT